MKSKKITALEVIRVFYIGNELLKDVFKNLKNKKGLDNSIKEIIAKSKKLSRETLLKYPLDNYHPRYDNYLNSMWELKEVDLKDCGVWPRMGGLPDEATKGSVLSTIEYIKPYLKDKNKLTLKTSRILYIEEMMKYAENVTEHLPIIVIEGGVIRHNKLISISQRKKYKKCKYDIDDGNHRAIALGLLGKKKIKALVGKRICKSDLLYC